MTTGIAPLTQNLPTTYVKAVATDDIVSILKTLLSNHEMSPVDYPVIRTTNDELEVQMRAEIRISGLLSQLEETVHISASLAEAGYGECTFEEKKNIAFYTQCLIYIDDMSSRDINPYLEFQQRFLRGLPQLDAVLDLLASVLHAMFDLYPPFFANAINNATFDFIGGTCIEPAIGRLNLKTSYTSSRFPWFLRKLTGANVAYALMPFPKSKSLEFVVCIQALADMDFWIAAVNDILSFYKEIIAGETANYICNRASIEAKTSLQVVGEMGREVVHARNNIYSVFSATGNTEAAKAWRTFESGYIIWHLIQKRYQLRDLGF